MPLTTPIDITAPNTVSDISGECYNEVCFSDVTITLTAGDYVSGVKEINYTIDGGQNITAAGDTASILLIGEGMHTIVYFARDNIGNIELPKSLRVNIDKSDVTPPSVLVTASPNILWPPDHKLVDVMIDGFAVDDISGVSSINIYVTDEYGEYNLNVPDFGSGIRLESWREGKDLDGRHYTITVEAIDRAGNQTYATTEVIVPHDLKK